MSNIAYADFGGKIADLTEHEYLLEDGAVNVQKVNALSGALVLPMMDSWADGNDPRMLYDRFQTWLDNGQYVGIYLYLQKMYEDSLLDLPPEYEMLIYSLDVMECFATEVVADVADWLLDWKDDHNCLRED